MLAKLASIARFLVETPAVTAVLLGYGGSSAWRFWQFHVRPLLLPATLVRMMAEALADQFGAEALDIARHYEADDNRVLTLYQRGRWRRIRRHLERRGVGTG